MVYLSLRVTLPAGVTGSKRKPADTLEKNASADGKPRGTVKKPTNGYTAFLCLRYAVKGIDRG